MNFARTRKIVDEKLMKLGLSIKYKVRHEKKEESWVFEKGHVVHLNPNDRKSHMLAIESEQHLLLHELGHIFADDYLTLKMRKDPEARKLFGDLTLYYRRSMKKKFEDTNYISNYAQVHPEDNFAEVFAVFVNFMGDIRKIRRFLKREKKSRKVLQQMRWMKRFIRMIGEKKPKRIHKRRPERMFS